MGAPDAGYGQGHLLEDDRYNSKVARAEYREEIDTIVQTWAGNKSKEEAVEGLLAADIPAAPVQTIKEVVYDPQLDHREMLNHRENRNDIGKGSIPIPGMPIKFSRSDTGEISTAPMVGEHTEEVLAEALSYSAAEIDELQNSDVF